MPKTVVTRAISAALAARRNAYAPYSRFAVGAAVVTKNGKIFTGVNVENASFGATVCAERVALFSAIAAGERDIVLLVVAATLDGHAVSPCGICRQVFAEFNPAAQVILVNAETGTVERETTVAALLPEQFSLPHPER